MEPLLAVAGIVTIAAISPGPNNVIVMAAATRGGLVAAMPAIAGVVLGSLLLLLLIWTGAAIAFEAVPTLRTILLTAGVLYLVWLGGTLVWRAGNGGADRASMPATALGVAAFQVLNPKAWVLVLTATAAMSDAASGPAVLGALAGTLAVISILCLSLWASAGAAIARYLKRLGAARWFDRTMGVLLICSAALLVI